MAFINIIKRNAPLEIDNDIAKKIKMRKFGLNNTTKARPDEPLNLGDWAGTYGEIRSIEITKKSRSDGQEKNWSKINREYEEGRKRELAKTPEQKAKNTELFKILYFGFTGQNEVPADILDQAIRIQESFFEKNPNRIHCDPIMFKKLNLGETCAHSVINFIENQIREDKRMAKYGK